MRAVVALVLFCVGVWSEGTDSDYTGWHARVGVKNAQEIQKRELVHFSNPIVGGAIAATHFHPYLVGLLIDVLGLSSPSACGGSLLTSTRVLTAAHCWRDGRFQTWRFTVVLGSPFLFYGGLRIPTSAIALHPNYDHRTFANDIAMLYLPIHVPFSSMIQPIQLPVGGFQTFDYTGIFASASGYGKYSDLTNPTTNTMVRNVFLQVITLHQCRAYYGDIILDSNICTNGAGGVGICQGDSGGPLTVTSNGVPILIGVSSFVAYDGCELGYPSAFASVPRFLSWIYAHL